MDKNKTLEELHGEDFKEDIDIHVDRILWKISSLEDEIERAKHSQTESIEFYNRKIESINSKISYRKSLLDSYMQGQFDMNGRKSLGFPNGTLKMTTRTSRDFGDDDSLIKFSYENNIPTRVTEKPDKKKIVEYIKKTADAPMDYKETKETTFSYKTNKHKETKWK